MHKGVKKRENAQSSILTIVLVVVLVLVIIAIVWFAYKQILENGKEKIEIAALQANFEIKDVFMWDNALEPKNEYNRLNVTVYRALGEAEVPVLIFLLEDSSGKMYKYDYYFTESFYHDELETIEYEIRCNYVKPELDCSDAGPFENIVKVSLAYKGKISSGKNVTKDVVDIVGDSEKGDGTAPKNDDFKKKSPGGGGGGSPPGAGTPVCANDCTQAGLMCTGHAVSMCAVDPGNAACFIKTTNPVCPAGKTCNSGACVEKNCPNAGGCTAEGLFCDVDTPYTCALDDESNCFERTDSASCGAGEICVEGMGCVDTATCEDKVMNQDETGVDCGGTCPACAVLPVCNNNIIEAGEFCDGTSLNGKTCLTQGYASGNLKCLADCSNYDYSDCAAACVAPACVLINSCRVLNQQNTVYKLSKNLVGAEVTSSADNACFSIQAKGITLDCDGHSITRQSNTIQKGVYTTHNGTIVKNCKFDMRGTGPNAYSAIHFREVSHSKILNNEILNGTYGMVIQDGPSIINITDIEIDGNIILNSTVHGAFLPFYHISRLVFTNNIVRYVNYTPYSAVQGNGLILNSRFEGNQINYNANGTYLNLKDSVFRNNVITWNTGHGISGGYSAKIIGSGGSVILARPFINNSLINNILLNNAQGYYFPQPSFINNIECGGNRLIGNQIGGSANIRDCFSEIRDNKFCSGTITCLNSPVSTGNSCNTGSVCGGACLAC